MNKNIIIFIAIILGLFVGFFVGKNSKINTTHTMSSMHTMENTTAPAAAHNHSMIEVDKNAPLPSIDIHVMKDVKDGYNLHINTTNFTFTPENVNKQNMISQGHGHIFINDTKLTRVYGNWYYISSDKLKPGDKVEVTLNANDHSELTIGGQHISSSVVVQ